eukprot:CAMPEP_0194417714 /NCGR_PEP_ID=MMETSP0176-20130528/16800_1 /TAXON_ID=216777 /ORGANISM="Proboscia alata, Strain PI-D3" /LENGTH=394 /DNA_ID=CAMNT_0039223751 /DNA_START=277 /DNA_END=1458 /DNA_ORIENTATION=+
MSKSTDSSGDDQVVSMQAAVIAPMYITIGAQCSGKTTALRKVFSQYTPPNNSTNFNTNDAVTEQKNLDITIDDQPAVFLPLPKEYFVNNLSQMPHEMGNKTVQGKTVFNRASDLSQGEMTLVLKRLCNQLSSEEFRRNMCDMMAQSSPKQQQRDGGRNYTHGNETQRNPQLVEYIAIVEQYCQEESANNSSKSLIKSPTIDLFIVESIFRKHPTHHTTAVESSLAKLASIPTSLPAGWGNTNTRPREYAEALSVAMKTQRPVQFLILPKLERGVLLMRNIKRFCETGRYVPMKAIDDATGRVHSILTNIVNKNQHSPNKADAMASLNDGDSSNELHAKLAQLAGYEMDPSTRRIIRKIPTAGNQQGGKSRGSRRCRDGNSRGGGGRYHQNRSNN